MAHHAAAILPDASTPPAGIARLVVLDWDDTCCPSSWIASSLGARGPSHQNGAPPSHRRQHPPKAELLLDAALETTSADEDVAERLRDVEAGIAAVLRTAEALGCAVAIITNADEAWVRFSCQRFLPRVVPLLARVGVVSARHYEGLYPGRSVCWKAAAFTHVAKSFFGTTTHGALSSGAADQSPPHPAREIISIGDSNDERLAARAAAAPLLATPKALKLVDAPRLGTVACQLHTVATCLPVLVEARHAVDVDLAAILAASRARDAVSAASVIPASDVHRVWQDAAWGVLTAIRVQGVAAWAAAAAEGHHADSTTPVPRVGVAPGGTEHAVAPLPTVALEA